jgi:hypothetical protein
MLIRVTVFVFVFQFCDVATLAITHKEKILPRMAID